jgi:hypothetical protein
MRRAERDDLRAVSAFTARYLHLVSDPEQVPVIASDLELLDRDGAPIPLSDTPLHGAVWIRATRAIDRPLVVHLVDLLGQHDDRWDAVRQRSPRRAGWRLHWRSTTGIVAMSPWTSAGEPLPLIDDRLPTFRRWLVVVVPPSSR